MRIVALALMVGAGCLSQAFAADTMISAVSFVLTGTDSSDIVAVDRLNCVFDLQLRYAAPTLEVFPNLASAQRFHMNNVDLSRVTIQQFHNDIGQQWLTEEIRGEGVIYESIGTQNGEAGRDLSRNSQITQRLGTSEVERVKRAWNFIYSHGCHSAKASF